MCCGLVTQRHILQYTMEQKDLSFHEYDGMVMSSKFPAFILDKIKETTFDDEDIIVTTYPKCGTTWIQQIVFLAQKGGDKPGSEMVPLDQQWQFIESTLSGNVPQLDIWASLAPPRFVKSHLTSEFFKKTLQQRKTKFIVVFRNPKDALVSYYHFYKLHNVFQFDGTWEHFFQLYKDKKIVHGDYFDVTLSWWKLRNDPRILFLKFEDMLKSPEDAIRQVVNHLGKSLPDEVVKQIAEKTSFKSMQADPRVNYSHVPRFKKQGYGFMRSGKVGDWKNHFSKEQAEYVDGMTKKLLEPEGLFMEDE